MPELEELIQQIAALTNSFKENEFRHFLFEYASCSSEWIGIDPNSKGPLKERFMINKAKDILDHVENIRRKIGMKRIYRIHYNCDMEDIRNYVRSAFGGGLPVNCLPADHEKTKERLTYAFNHMSK